MLPCPSVFVFFLSTRPPPTPTLFPYTTLFRSSAYERGDATAIVGASVFATALVLLYLASTLFHALPQCRAKQVFQILDRSEEHTSELQSHSDLVCRLLLEKKKKK